MVHVGPRGEMFGVPSDVFFYSGESIGPPIWLTTEAGSVQVQSQKPIFVPVDCTFRICVNRSGQCCQECQTFKQTFIQVFADHL